MLFGSDCNAQSQKIAKNRIQHNCFFQEINICHFLISSWHLFISRLWHWHIETMMVSFFTNLYQSYTCLRRFLKLIVVIHGDLIFPRNLSSHITISENIQHGYPSIQGSSKTILSASKLTFGHFKIPKCKIQKLRLQLYQNIGKDMAIFVYFWNVYLFFLEIRIRFLSSTSWQ